MKIFTLGNGFVGKHLKYPILTERVELSSNYIDNLLDKYKPDVLVNCIGKTGRPNIDSCESNKEITASINVALPIMLAEACKKKSIHMIQIGSGCIFSGDSPRMEFDCGCGEPCFCESNKLDPGWEEKDFANPQSFYSRTKYACDLALNEMNATILRIRMPISTMNDQRNLINKLIGYQKIIDIPNSVSFMDDLVRCIDWFTKEKHTGIWHVTNPQPLTAARVVREYQKYVPSHRFNIINESELDTLTVAKRSNCILNSNKLRHAGFHMTDSEEALKKCMASYISFF